MDGKIWIFTTFRNLIIINPYTFLNMRQLYEFDIKAISTNSLYRKKISLRRGNEIKALLFITSKVLWHVLNCKACMKITNIPSCLFDYLGLVTNYNWDINAWYIKENTFCRSSFGIRKWFRPQYIFHIFFSWKCIIIGILLQRWFHNIMFSNFYPVNIS